MTTGVPGPPGMPRLKGKWAKGIEPRMFVWVIKDRLAASERIGGYARNHRRIRRMEEIIWLREQGFTMILSLLDSPHNLHAYDEMEMPHTQVGLGEAGDYEEHLPTVYQAIDTLMAEPTQRVLVHLEEFGDRLCGTIAGYLLWAGMVETGPMAISVVERLTGRQLGPDGREIVSVTLEGRLRRG
ncbi:MAG: hypothetical protein ACRDY7_00715 [Acidimicrobiia bacterium]